MCALDIHGMQKLWCCQIPRNQTVLGHRDMMICKHAVVQSGSCNTTGFIWTSSQPCFQTEKASGPPGWAPTLLTPNLLLCFPGQTRNKFPVHLLLSMRVTQPKLRLALTGRHPSLKCPYLSLWERRSERDTSTDLKRTSWKKGKKTPSYPKFQNLFVQSQQGIGTHANVSTCTQ